MPTRQFAETGITSRGPTAEEDNLQASALSVQTITDPATSTPGVVEDMNVLFLTDATVKQEWQIVVNCTPDNPCTGIDVLDPTIATLDEFGFTHYVSDGVARFVVKSRMGNRTLRLAHSITGGNSETEFVSFVTGSLAREASDAVDSRIDGETPAVAQALYTTQDHSGSGTYVRNPDFWAADIDLTCISPWNSTSDQLRAGTAITPRHIIFANHYPIGINDTVRFVTAGNVVVDRTMTARLRVGTSDFMIGLLDSDLPATITPCEMMADEITTKLPNLDQRIPALCLDQEEKGLVSDWVYAGSSNTMAVPNDPQRFAFHETIISGDSGNPCGDLINVRFVLLATWLYGGAGSGPATQYYLTEIQTAIDTLGAFGHSIDVVDLSSYPSY